jgi:hypothetical protein
MPFVPSISPPKTKRRTLAPPVYDMMMLVKMMNIYSYFSLVLHQHHHTTNAIA